MTKDELEELLEIRQAHDDTLLRLDREFTKNKGKNGDIAQAIKVMIHVKKRLKALSEGKI